MHKKEGDQMNRELRFHNRRHHYCTLLPSGGIRIDFAPSRNVKDFHLPPPEIFKEKIRKQKGRETAGDVKRLSMYGLVFKGECSVSAGREALGLGSSRSNYVTKQEVDKVLRTFWPIKACKAHEQEKGTLHSLKEFRMQHPRIHHALTRNSHFNGVEATLDAYHPGLYHAVSRVAHNFHKTVDAEGLRKKIREAYGRGVLLTRAGLYLSLNAEERKLGKQIEKLRREKNKNKPKEEKIPFIDYAARLGGLDKQEVKLVTSAQQSVAQAAERITEFYLVWAGLTGKDALHLPLDEVYRRYAKTKFNYGDKVGRADVRMGTQAIEVKTGAHALAPEIRADILAKYGSRKGTWDDSDKPITETFLFLQKKEPGFLALRKELKGRNITVIGYDAFHGALEYLVDHLKKSPYAVELEECAPTLSDGLEVVVRAHEALGSYKIYGRATHTRLWEWTNEYITRLIEVGKRRYERPSKEEERNDDNPF
jgi:hypothetical protein